MLHRCLAIAALLAALPAHSAEPTPAFSFLGLRLDSDLAEVATRFPGSKRTGGSLTIDAEDSGLYIGTVELSGAGSSRKLRVSFERPLSTPDAPQTKPRYPPCDQVQRLIEPQHGPPRVSRFAEEGTQRSDRSWRRANERLTLICFGPPDATGPALVAEAVVITR